MFERLAETVQPRLRRYCTRMAGSAVDGEDILQDALVKALQAFPGDGSVADPEAWLFRVAHNTALDFLRRRIRMQAVIIEGVEDAVADPVDEIDQRQIAAISLRTFMKLSPAERSSVILKDVIGYSVREIGAIVAMTEPAVKAALHRGRARLEVLSEMQEDREMLSVEEHQRLTLYIDRFNARDFDAVRDLLAEDVRLDLIGRLALNGKAEVSRYFTNYAALSDWRFDLGLIDGQAAIIGSDPNDIGRTPTYVVLLEWSNGQVSRIRDFYHAREVVKAATIRFLSTSQASAR